MISLKNIMIKKPLILSSSEHNYKAYIIYWIWVISCWEILYHFLSTYATVLVYSWHISLFLFVDIIGVTCLSEEKILFILRCMPYLTTCLSLNDWDKREMSIHLWLEFLSFLRQRGIKRCVYKNFSATLDHQPHKIQLGYIIYEVNFHTSFLTSHILFFTSNYRIQ